MNGNSEASSSDSPHLAVKMLEAIAEARDQDVTSLSPLGEFLDADALEVLVKSTAVPITVTLEVYEYTVEIDSKENVTVTESLRKL